jgi:hypothetical protein
LLNKQKSSREDLQTTILEIYGLGNNLLVMRLSCKKNSGNGFLKYNQPSRVLKIWLANQRSKTKSIAKYMHLMFTWKKRAKTISINQPIIKSNSKIIQELKLTTEEIDYIKNN